MLSLDGMDFCTLQTICTVLAVLGALVFCLKRRSAAKRTERQEKWNNAGKDVVVLHQFPRATFCPNPSPYPIKIETFLRATGIEYVNDFEDFTSPKGKCPWITINGENVSDSQLSMEREGNSETGICSEQPGTVFDD